MSTRKRDTICSHILKRGPRRGQQCGVGCSSVVGRCAKHKESKTEATSSSTVLTCSICLDDVKFPHTNGVETECGHVFHAECLGKVRGNSCPNCRASLGRPSPPEPPVIENNHFHVIIMDENENPVFIHLVESGIIVNGPNMDPYFLATSEPWLMIDALLMGSEIPTRIG